MPTEPKPPFKRPPHMTVLSDLAVDHEQLDTDLLDLEQRLGPIYDILRHENTLTPMAIAVYGDWGAGKSSAMRWLQGQLNQWNKQPKNVRGQHKIVRSVWFDPWKYSKREDVWRGLISEVIIHCIDTDNLDENNAIKRITAATKTFGGFLGKSFLHALSNIAVKAKLPAGQVELKGAMFRDIYDEFKQATHPEKAYLNDFEQTLRNWIKEYVPSKTERMVVFIDDLDRCLPEVALEVLEALKLYLNIPDLIFVLGVDREVVDGLVKEHYKKYGLGERKSSRYMDKMFQAEVWIAPSEIQIESYLDSQIKLLNKATNNYWSDMLGSEAKTEYRTIIEGVIRKLCEHNPREIKRLLNSAMLWADSAVRTSKKGDEAKKQLRFVQGAQVFLIWRILYNWHRPLTVLLQDTDGQKLFEEWSQIIIDHPAAIPLSDQHEKDDAADLEAKAMLVSRRRWPDQYSKEKPAEGSTEVYEQFENKWSAYYEQRQLRLLLQDHDLKTLLKIPFSKDVASHAAVATPHETAFELGDIPKVIAEAVAKQSRKRVEALKSEDYQAVAELNLRSSNIRDDDLAYLASLANLHKLVLSKTSIIDADLAHLASLANLQVLYISDTSITDAGLTHLASLANLRDLSLFNSNITDAGLEHLTKLANLQELSLGNTSITDTGLAHLVSLANLQLLHLYDTFITDAGLAHLATLTNLRKLTLDNTSITDAGLVHLASLTNLRILSLKDTSITDAGLAHLTSLAYLRHLSIINTSITDAGVAKFQNVLHNCVISH